MDLEKRTASGKEYQVPAGKAKDRWLHLTPEQRKLVAESHKEAFDGEWPRKNLQQQAWERIASPNRNFGYSIKARGLNSPVTSAMLNAFRQDSSLSPKEAKKLMFYGFDYLQNENEGIADINYVQKTDTITIYKEGQRWKLKVTKANGANRFDGFILPGPEAIADKPKQDKPSQEDKAPPVETPVQVDTPETNEVKKDNLIILNYKEGKEDEWIKKGYLQKLPTNDIIPGKDYKWVDPNPNSPNRDVVKPAEGYKWVNPDSDTDLNVTKDSDDSAEAPTQTPEPATTPATETEADTGAAAAAEIPPESLDAEKHLATINIASNQAEKAVAAGYLLKTQKNGLDNYLPNTKAGYRYANDGTSSEGEEFNVAKPENGYEWSNPTYDPDAATFDIKNLAVTPIITTLNHTEDTIYEISKEMILNAHTQGYLVKVEATNSRTDKKTITFSAEDEPTFFVPADGFRWDSADENDFYVRKPNKKFQWKVETQNLANADYNEIIPIPDSTPSAPEAETISLNDLFTGTDWDNLKTGALGQVITARVNLPNSESEFVPTFVTVTKTGDNLFEYMETGEKSIHFSMQPDNLITITTTPGNTFQNNTFEALHIMLLASEAAAGDSK